MPCRVIPVGQHPLPPGGILDPGISAYTWRGLVHIDLTRAIPVGQHPGVVPGPGTSAYIWRGLVNYNIPGAQEELW